MIKINRRIASKYFLFFLLNFGSFSAFLAVARSDQNFDKTSESMIIDEKFTHFELSKGEKINLVEPYASLWDILQSKPENYRFQDYRGPTFTAMDLLHPLAIMVNRTTPKGTEVLAESLVRKLDSKDSILNEVMITATEFYKAMEMRSPVVPPSAGQVLIKGAEVAAQSAVAMAAQQYSEPVRAKLEDAFKKVFEKYKLDIEKGEIEKVRQALFETTLNTINEYMATYYDPNEMVFKGLIVGGHAKGDLLKYFESTAKKLLPPVITENGHVKGSVGLILHSPRKITTVNAFDTTKILNEKVGLTITPAFWAAVRLKDSQGKEKVSNADTNQTNSAETIATGENDGSTTPVVSDGKFVSPANSFYWTIGSIWGTRGVEITNLTSYEGVFAEMNFFLLGFTLNINQAFFFESLAHLGEASAVTTSISIEHSGFRKYRRDEIKSHLGKFKVIPNGGYLNVFPLKDYSTNITNL